MRILVDGVIFSLTTGEECRFWTSLIGRLAQIESLSVCLLDRGFAPSIAGVQRFDFPSLTSTYTPADSLLIQKFCDKLAIDVFVSTAYTSPTTTPQVQLVYDRLPDVLLDTMSRRALKERELVFSYASHFACTCKSARVEILRRYPDIAGSRVSTTFFGAEPETFRFASSHGTQAFRDKYGVTRPYFLIDGGFDGQRDNVCDQPVFDAIKVDQAADFDIIVVGPKRAREAGLSREFPGGLSVKRLDLAADELASAYAGALGFIYPTRSIGFGMPIIEAMASGCPVITTYQESLGDGACEAAVVVVGDDSHELLQAMELVRQPDRRKRFIEAGRELATTFSWDNSTRAFLKLLKRSRAERFDEDVANFHRRWKKVRTIQSYVDIGVD